MINGFFIMIGQFLEVLSFFASLPTIVLSSLAQAFYLAGNTNQYNNDEEETED